MTEYWHFVPLIGWLAVAAIGCYGVIDCVLTLKPPPAIEPHPQVALIIPVRGVPPNFAALWTAICAQSLRPARVIFAIESEKDSATAVIRSFSGGPPVQLVVSGPTQLRAQKVHNLLAALATLSPEDGIIVFADADIVPHDDWLQRLVIPLNDPEIEAVSGYRWMTPADDAWSSALVSVANASVATLPRSPAWNLAWGGSTALRREALDALDLPRFWKNAVLDDLPLTIALRARGITITAPQSLLVPSPTTMGWRTAIAFGRRQYLFVRWFAPKHWALAATATTLPIAGWITALPLAFAGNRFAIAVIIVANLLDQVRASLRQPVPRFLFGTEMPRRMALLDRFATPLWLAFHACIVWSTLFRRSITWANRTYHIDVKCNVVRIDRHGP